MNDKSYFAVAVIIALVVPMIFGSIYFFRMSALKDGNRYVATLKDTPDLVLSGKFSIDEKRLSTEEKTTEFTVQYVRGETDKLDYTLYLKNIEFEGNSASLDWSLYMFDEIENKYFVYDSGTINRDTSKKIVLGNHIQAKFLGSQKFRFSYLSDKEEEAKFSAELVLEQE